MTLCKFCQRTFKNKQAFVAHLKSCAKYQEAKAHPQSAAKGKSPQAKGKASEPIRTNSPQAPANDPLEQFQSLFAKWGQSSTGDPALSLASHRRKILQEVKRQAVDGYFGAAGPVTLSMRSDARDAIEKDLSHLPLEEIPFPELLERGQALRDKVYLPIFQKHRSEQEQEAMRQREQLEQLLCEQRKAAERERRKTYHGEMARLRVKAECERRGIAGKGQWSAEQMMEQRLQGMLTGDESEREATEFIQVLIAQHFEAYDALVAARGERRRQRLFNQLEDIAIGFTPVAIAMATPALQKGINFVVDKLGLSTSPTSSPSSQPGPDQDGHREQPHASSPHQSKSNTYSDIPPSSEGVSGQEQPPPGTQHP